MRITIACLIALLSTSVISCGSDKVAVSSSFRNISSAIPPISTYGNYGALWGDFNSDGRVDLIFMGHGEGPLMLAQKEDNTFADVTSKSGIKTSGWAYTQQNDRHGASCADFDNDGKLDLYISHGAQQGETVGIKYDELLRGNGDFTFSDITDSTGTLNQFGRGRSGIWFDYNSDGWLDLYVTNYLSNNVLYKNNGDSTFTDVTAESGLGFSGAHAAPADFDQDGHIDLLVTWPLRLLRNNNLGRFVELSKSEFKYKDMFAYGIVWGDFDNDGDLDIFFSGLGNDSMLLVNDNGTYRELEESAWKLSADTISTGVAVGDMDNDGLLDLVNIRSDGYFIYQNKGELSFSAVKLDAPAPAITVEKSGDAALADFDNDGLLDIATDDSNKYMLLRNETATSNHWLKLQFQGKSNNRLGIGNKIWITSRGHLVAYREYTGTPGSLRSASCMNYI